MANSHPFSYSPPSVHCGQQPVSFLLSRTRPSIHTATALSLRVRNSCSRLLYVCFFVGFLMMFAVVFLLKQQQAHFSDRNRRQRADKQQHHSQEKSEGTNERGEIPYCRIVHTPGRWHEITMQTNDHNH